ncbi:MAG: ATP synthase subunit I [Acidobacteria bacterium Pan2503]|uniref:ATP synthase subunit I n=1 Tax=Candidatus Acidiferrum panamense TaxID=2741543 RepID=A0A7V8NLQ2_9BACT|nr:ATP synthase subunit I [Candidatus Acidoferrum panamensis]
MTMDAQAADRAASSSGRQTEQRIGWLTLFFGLVATAVVLGLRHKRWAAGLAIGTVLGWLNFRWLKRAADVLVIVSTAQEGREKPKVPLTAYLAPLFRYGLLGLTVYVIFVFLHVPLGSMILGFCALAAAAIAASVWEILRPVD